MAQSRRQRATEATLSVPMVSPAGVTSIGAPPLPYTLGDVQVTIQGKTTRILGLQPTSLTVLAPPDLTPGADGSVTTPIHLDVVSSAPFDGPAIPVRVSNSAPEFLIESHHTLVAHQDWSALVTAANPGHPGEILHSYAVGLGDTSPAVPYGEAAPGQEPLARLATSYQCTSDSKEVQVLFQGLAPSLAGIYQVDWGIPADAPAGDFFLTCRPPGALTYPSVDAAIPVGP